MKTIQENNNTQFDLIQKGYQVLYREIGPTDTLRFMMSFYSGSGDSVAKFKKLWKNKTISQIAKDLRT